MPTAPPDLLNAFYPLYRAQSHVDVLIDPVANEEWRQLEPASSLDDAHICPLRDELFNERPQLAPTLLRITSQHFEAVDGWLSLAVQEAQSPAPQARLVCAFLVNTPDLHLLGGLLSLCLSAQAPGRRAMYFRYFDPRVFEHLPRVLTRAQWARLLPARMQWCHLDGCGQWGIHEGAAPGEYRANGLHFDAQQWTSIESIEHFNASRQALRSRGIGDPAMPAEALFERVLNARRRGLNEPADVAQYILVSALIGQELATQLPWEQVLTALAGGAKLSALVPV